MENLITKIDAVSALYGRDSYSKCDANGNVTWKDDHTTTDAEVEAINSKYQELLAEHDAQAYARNRKAEYPSIEECIHAILDDDLTALQAKRQAVKDKYPKG
jgi:hypothetical protein